MRSFITCLLVFVAMACFSLTANADLLSLYTFDNTADNAVGTAPDGTVHGGASYVPGKIGNALSLDGVDDYVDTTTAGLPNGANGMEIGSVSFWIKTTTDDASTVLGSFNDGGNTGFALKLNTAQPDTHSLGGLFLYTRADEGGNCCPYLTTSNNVWRNGSWHQVVLTWNLMSGGNPGTGQYYIDGVAEPTSMGWNFMNSGRTLSPWDHPMRIGTVGRESPLPGTYVDGSLDDMGVWSNRLSDTQVAAIYNLACDLTLNYNSADAAILFETFAGGPGTENTTSDGNLWVYSSSLAGTPGSVVNHSGVVLNDGGVGGVQLVPEPGTTILLGMAAAAGLIVCAWKKQK